MGALGLVLGGVRDQFSAFKLIKAAPSVDTTKPVAGSTSKTALSRKKQLIVICFGLVFAFAKRSSGGSPVEVRTARFRSTTELSPPPF